MRKMLCAVIAMMAISVSAIAAEWAKPVPNNCTLESGQNYYFYNPTAEKFIFANGGMQVSLTDEGSVLKLTMLDNGDWTMEGENGLIFADVDYVGSDGTSADINVAWYIEKQTSGSCKFRPSKSDVDFSWEMYPDMWTGLSYAKWDIAPLLKAEDGGIEWYIVSENDYASFISKVGLHNVMTELQEYGYDVSALLAVYNDAAADKAAYDNAIASVQEDLTTLRIENASEDRPFDVTSRYLRNADLTEAWVDGGHDVPGWTMEPASFCGMGEFDNEGFYQDNKTLGSWSGGAFGDNKIYQTVTGLKNGKYKFGNYGLWIRHTGEEGDPIKGAYIYAKVGDKVFKEPLTDTGWWRGLSEVVFECRTGEAEVGIMFEGTNVGQCIILDFKLEYLGEKKASVRLNALIENANAILSEEAINEDYANKLKNDIEKANALIAADDAEGQEALFAVFTQDYEEAVANKEAYVTLAALVEEADIIIGKGDSDAMGVLSDYLLDNDLVAALDGHSFDNDKIQEVIKTLALLNEKAANSIISAGTDVTDLLVNGHFDSNGGWKATLNDFSIDTGKKIMSKWWTDWKAEQIVNNVANGTYRLEVQGFQWCHWDWSSADSDWASGDGSDTYKVGSKIRLNDGEVTIYNVFACGETDIKEGFETSQGWFVPNSESSALKFFEQGLYNNVVEAQVTDNTLRIEFDCSVQGFWNCFYNLRLTYIGADISEAIDNLDKAMTKANEYLAQKMGGDVRKEIEDAIAVGDALMADRKAKYDDVNNAANAIVALYPKAEQSIKAYIRLNVSLDLAADALKNERVAATEAGKELNDLYLATKADYDSQYPSLDEAGVAAVAEKIESLIAKAKSAGGVKEGEEVTDFMTNASFENTYGNDVSLGNGAHTVPFGWTMKVEGKDCYTAQEISDAGINSWTAIEDNKFTTDGEHSYCLLSAPTPDAYLYQTVKGLPAGTYKVSVDMTVPFDGGCSRLTTQRLLVNNVAQYYGKATDYKAEVLDSSYPEEVSRSFAGYDEVNSTLTGEAGDMGNMSTLSVEVTIGKGESIVIGVRTDNNKAATNCNYENNGWDCCGRYKIDNFRIFCLSIDAAGVEDVKENKAEGNGAYNMMGIKVNPESVRGMYILNGKKYIR